MMESIISSLPSIIFSGILVALIILLLSKIKNKTTRDDLSIQLRNKRRINIGGKSDREIIDLLKKLNASKDADMTHKAG